MTTYRSAHNILKGLPPVLTANDIQRAYRCSRSQVSVYVHRFADRGLIVPVGPRVSAYFNLVSDPHAAINRREEMADLLFPSAIVGSLTVLHDEGVITQIPSDLHVMVLSRRSYPEVHGIVLHPRSIGWFRKMHDEQMIQPGIQRTGSQPASLPRLTPEAALVDALKYRDGWVSDVSDTDLQSLDVRKVSKLVKSLRVSEKEIRPFLDELEEGQGVNIVRFR